VFDVSTAQTFSFKIKAIHSGGVTNLSTSIQATVIAPAIPYAPLVNIAPVFLSDPVELIEISKNFSSSSTESTSTYTLPEVVDPNGETFTITVSGLATSFMAYHASNTSFTFNKTSVVKADIGEYSISIVLTD